MSTKNTAQNKLKGKFRLLFDPLQENLTNQSFSKLSERLVENVKLRRFFINNIFPDLFSTDAKLVTFVQSTEVFPAIFLESSGHALLEFFDQTQHNAEKVFKSKLDRTFENVCSNACDLGIFEPQSYLVGDKEELKLINSERYDKEYGDVQGTFYKVAPVLKEPWLKAPDRGKMLELWTCLLLKEHLAKTAYEVLWDVKVVEDKLKLWNLESIAGKKKAHITAGQLDCMITHKGDDYYPVGVVECKTKDFGWSELRAFCGSLNFFGAQFGAVVIGNTETFKTDRTFQNIRIFTNVVEREDFPNVLFDYVDSKLPN
jgi:hypothetical protein